MVPQAVLNNRRAHGSKGRKLLKKMNQLNISPTRHFFHLYLQAWGKEGIPPGKGSPDKTP